MKTTMIRSLAFSLSMAACGGSTGQTSQAAAPSSGAVTQAMPASPAAVLDGATYDVSLEFPGEQPIKDTLSFASGRFESSACTSIGFPKWTSYEAQVDKGKLGFAVVTHHPEGATVEWHGAVQGDVIEGTANRTMKGKTVAGTFHGAHK